MIEIPKPMLASIGRKAFSDPGWLYEVKFDGYRMLAGVDAGEVELRTRNAANCTGWYPEVAEALAQLEGGPHIIDGEVCCLDDLGRSDFEKLHARSRRRRRYAGCDQVTYMAFDLLVHAGQPIMQLPLVERKERLEQLLARLPKHAVLYVKDLPADESLFGQFVHGLKLEGFVAKRKASVYTPGIVTTEWVKLKRPGWEEGRSWRK